MTDPDPTAHSAANQAGHGAPSDRWAEENARARAVEPINADLRPRPVPTTHWIDTLAIDDQAAPVRVGTSVRTQNTFQLVMLTRRSELTTSPPDGAAVCSLLESLTTTTDKALDAAGRQWSSRIYPSAGGTHCIRFVAYTSELPGWPDGHHRWSSAHSTIQTLQPSSLTDVIAPMTRTTDNPISCALIAVADIRILDARYPNASSLLWRDAGAALATAHLLATDLAMASTISAASADLSPHSQRPIHAVGALLLSAKAAVS